MCNCFVDGCRVFLEGAKGLGNCGLLKHGNGGTTSKETAKLGTTDNK